MISEPNFPDPIDYLLRISEVEKQVGLGRSAIYRRMANGMFPIPLAIGCHQIRWPQSVITAWRQSLPVATYRLPRGGVSTEVGHG